MSQLRSIVDRTYAAFNARDFDVLREVLDERVELVMSGIAVHGLTAVVDFVGTTGRARPGLRIEPQRVFVDTGDTLVTEVLMVDDATAGADGGPLVTSACGLYRLAGGRIVEWRVYTDPLGEGLASQALIAVAAEQSALRRVAELVARQSSPEDVFAAVTEELSRLLDADAARMVRFEPRERATVVAAWGTPHDVLPPGTTVPLARGSVIDRVFRTGRPARVDDYAHVEGPDAALLRERGTRNAAGSPIVVDGRLWGALVAGTVREEPLPAASEERIAEFAALVSTAISNIEARAEVERLAAEQSALRHVAERSRADLAESRTRIVRAGDEARRRFERDLHDGAQQRLVSLGLELRAVEATLPSELGDVRARLSGLAAAVGGVLDDLRELSRGLHPAVLSEGGLMPALGSLARRSAVPVDLRLDVGGGRLEGPIEVAAYYVVSEALANTAKHARASRVEVAVRRGDASLQLLVRDDGRGGADASSGSGLTGLVDRVEAVGGTIEIDSRPDRGTALHVELPT